MTKFTSLFFFSFFLNNSSEQTVYEHRTHLKHKPPTNPKHSTEPEALAQTKPEISLIIIKFQFRTRKHLHHPSTNTHTHITLHSVGTQLPVQSSQSKRRNASASNQGKTNRYDECRTQNSRLLQYNPQRFVHRALQQATN